MFSIVCQVKLDYYKIDPCYNKLIAQFAITYGLYQLRNKGNLELELESTSALQATLNIAVLRKVLANI